MKLRMPPPRVRRWIYRVCTAGLGVVAVYGWVTGEEAAAWLLVVGAVTGMAGENVEPAPSSTPDAP